MCSLTIEVESSEVDQDTDRDTDHTDKDTDYESAGKDSTKED